MAFFKSSPSITMTDTEFRHNGDPVLKIKDGYLVHYNKSGIDNVHYIKFPVRHLETAILSMSDKNNDIRKTVSIKFIGKGVILGTIDVMLSDNIAEELLDWILDKIQ